MIANDSAKKQLFGRYRQSRVRRQDRRLWFEVSEDGRGFDTAAPKSGGELQNLRDRLGVLGGGVEAKSARNGHR